MSIFPTSLDLGTARRALRALVDDPDDTKQAFRIVKALGGPSTERMFRRFRATPAGAAVLRERRTLLDALTDTTRLEALSEGTVGHAYLAFLRTHQLTAAGLVDASERSQADELDEERRRFSDRLRDMHDLWHVVTGYRGDIVGETAILAFIFAQTKNPGAGLIALVGFAKIGPIVGARTVIACGFVRGLRAEWLVATDWEAMLARPLVDVRRELGLDEPPVYDPVYTSDEAAIAQLRAA
ncbi:Coq4 family protein [soil metagenome]